jgi:hypothetical protein
VDFYSFYVQKPKLFLVYCIKKIYLQQISFFQNSSTKYFLFLFAVFPGIISQIDFHLTLRATSKNKIIFLDPLKSSISILELNSLNQNFSPEAAPF